MAKISGTVEFRTEYCKGCELCIDVCPQDCLAMSTDLNRRGYHFALLTSDTCTGCANCALICPDAVITVYRQPISTASANSRTAHVAAVEH